MNYIYDITLNFLDNYYEFYEWDKKDNIIRLDEIPIIRVNSIVMNDILSNNIQFSLEDIFNNCFLITDMSRVIGIKVDDVGFISKYSSLLIDEEDFVLDEINNIGISDINYRIIGKRERLLLSRRELYIRDYLLREIEELYNNKKYDEIDYLYREINNKNKDYYYEYKYLIDSISNNYNDTYNKLYSIIKLTQ